MEQSKYWEIDGVVEKLDEGWNSKQDLSKDATKKWIKENVLNSTTFIDVGCGTGFYTKTASDICGPQNYLGVDITKKMIDFCKKKYPNLTFKIGNIVDLSDIADNSFDIVMSCDVILHIRDCSSALRELYRIAKKKILIKTPLKNGSDYGIEEEVRGEFVRPYWIGYDIDRFRGMVNEVISDKDKVSIQNVKEIKSEKKKGCYWALIEITKEGINKTDEFYINFSDIINTEGERDVSAVTDKQILEAYYAGMFGPLLLYQDTNIIENGHFRYSLFKKAGLEKIPVTYDRSIQIKGKSHEWYSSMEKLTMNNLCRYEISFIDLETLNPGYSANVIRHLDVLEKYDNGNPNNIEPFKYYEEFWDMRQDMLREEKEGTKHSQEYKDDLAARQTVTLYEIIKKYGYGDGPFRNNFMWAGKRKDGTLRPHGSHRVACLLHMYRTKHIMADRYIMVCIDKDRKDKLNEA